MLRSISIYMYDISTPNIYQNKNIESYEDEFTSTHTHTAVLILQPYLDTLYKRFTTDFISRLTYHKLDRRPP